MKLDRNVGIRLNRIPTFILFFLLTQHFFGTYYLGRCHQTKSVILKQNNYRVQHFIYLYFSRDTQMVDFNVFEGLVNYMKKKKMTNLNFFYFYFFKLVNISNVLEVHLHLFCSLLIRKRFHCMVVTQFVTVGGCSLIIINHHSHLYFLLLHVTLPSCFHIPQFSLSIYISPMFQLLLLSLSSSLA